MSWRVGGITIIDVMHAMGIEPTNDLTWSVGNQVRDLYESRYSALPEKDLRTKTNGTGSHCFAVYPETMRADIVKIIKAQHTERQRQGELFPRPDPGDLHV